MTRIFASHSPILQVCCLYCTAWYLGCSAVQALFDRIQASGSPLARVESAVMQSPACAAGLGRTAANGEDGLGGELVQTNGVSDFGQQHRVPPQAPGTQGILVFMPSESAPLRVRHKMARNGTIHITSNQVTKKESRCRRRLDTTLQISASSVGMSSVSLRTMPWSQALGSPSRRGQCHATQAFLTRSTVYI